MISFDTRLAACMVALSLAVAGCNQQQSATKSGDKAEKAEATQDKGAKGDDDATKTAVAAESGPCGEYGAKLCEAMGGDKTPNCSAAKQTLKLMPPSACKAGLADIAFTQAKLKEMGKSCTELSTRLCKDLGEETQSCAMVKAQTPSFPPQRCDGMLEQYDKVLADLKRREDANKPLNDEKKKAITANAVATFGPEDAKVTVVEFSDFQCPYCSRAANAVTELKKKYEGKGGRMVFRQFPLSFHTEAHLAAQASLAAAAQGKFWEFHDALFANQRALKRPELEEHAKKVGLDMAAFKKALDDETHKAAVDADLKLGETVAVTGTPTMFVNGTRVANPTDVGSISTVIDAELAK